LLVVAVVEVLAEVVLEGVGLRRMVVVLMVHPVLDL
jgi:hypothetical protein